MNIKKLFFLLFLCSGLMYSCSEDLTTESSSMGGGDVDVKVNVKSEDIKCVPISRSVGTMNENYAIRYVLEMYVKSTANAETGAEASDVIKDPTNAKLAKRMVKYIRNYNGQSAQFEFRLPQGAYTTVAWVDYVKLKDNEDAVETEFYNVDKLYDIRSTFENKKVAEYENNLNSYEYKDAFYSTYTDNITKENNAINVKVSHATAQIRLVANDVVDLFATQEAYEADNAIPANPIRKVELDYSNKCNGFNAATGYAKENENNDNTQYASTFMYGGNKAEYAYNKDVILTDYVFAKDYINDVAINVTYASGHINKCPEAGTKVLANVPVVKKQITNITGPILTKAVDLKVSVDDNWNTIETNIGVGTQSKEITNGQGFEKINPFPYNVGEFHMSTVSGKQTDTEATIKARFASNIGETKILKDIRVEEVETVHSRATDNGAKTFKIYAVLNINETAYTRNLKIKVPYSEDGLKSYDQNIYQAPTYTSITVAGISNVGGKKNVNTFAEAYKNRYTSISTLPSTNKAMITSVFGTYKDGSYYYNDVVVVVKTRRNPKNLKLAYVTEGNKLLEGGVPSISSAQILTDGKNNWANVDEFTSWNANNEYYLRYVLKFKASQLAQTSNVDNYTRNMNFYFTDLTELYANVAKPTYTSGCTGTTSKVVNSKNQVLTFTLVNNPVVNYKEISNGNTTVSGSQFGTPGQYFSVNGKEDITLQFQSSREIEESDFVVSAPLNTNLTVTSFVKSPKVWNAPYTYTIKYTLSKLIKNVSAASSAYTINGAMLNEKDEELTKSKIASATVYQAGYTHALNQVRDSNNKLVNGYINTTGKNVYGSSLSQTDESTKVTFYLRTNVLSNVNDVKSSIIDKNNKQPNGLNVTQVKDANLSARYAEDYLYKVVLTLPVNETSKIVSTTIYSKASASLSDSSASFEPYITFTQQPSHNPKTY